MPISSQTKRLLQARIKNYLIAARKEWGGGNGSLSSAVRTIEDVEKAFSEFKEKYASSDFKTQANKAIDEIYKLMEDQLGPIGEAAIALDKLEELLKENPFLKKEERASFEKSIEDYKSDMEAAVDVVVGQALDKDAADLLGVFEE